MWQHLDVFSHQCFSNVDNNNIIMIKMRHEKVLLICCATINTQGSYVTCWKVCFFLLSLCGLNSIRHNKTWWFKNTAQYTSFTKRKLWSLDIFKGINYSDKDSIQSPLVQSITGRLLVHNQFLLSVLVFIKYLITAGPISRLCSSSP